VKSHSEKPTSDALGSPGLDADRLTKREITMPDGRYMIFYTDASDKQASEKRTSGNGGATDRESMKS
jgi:hypothetical protein